MKHALPTLLACVAGTASAAPAEGLSSRYPDMRWTEEAALEADLDGDGRSDRFAMGIGQDGRSVIGVRLANGRYSRLVFEPSALTCSVLEPDGCDEPAPPRATVLRDADRRDLALMFEISPDVFVGNGRAHIIVVPVGETDPFWFYWDRHQNALSWLRL